MIKPKPLIFIPDDVKFVKKIASFSSPDYEKLSVEEKIRLFPEKRQEILLKEKISGRNIKKQNKIINMSTSNSKIEKNNEDINISEKRIKNTENERKYIKNLTKTLITLDFTAEPPSKDFPRGTKPIVIKHFVDTTLLDISHPEIQGLLNRGYIEIVPESVMREEKNQIDKSEEQKKIELEKKRKEAEEYRRENPNSSKDFRGSFSMNDDIVYDEPIGGQDSGSIDLGAEAIDVGATGSGGSASISGDSAEMDNLVQQALNESTGENNSASSEDVNQMSEMFTKTEYNQHEE